MEIQVVVEVLHQMLITEEVAAEEVPVAQELRHQVTMTTPQPWWNRYAITSDIP